MWSQSVTLGCQGHDGVSRVTIVAMSDNAPKAVIPNLGYDLWKEAAKGHAS